MPDTHPESLPEMTPARLARLRAAIQLRDRCTRAAVDAARRLDVPLDTVQARVAYDAMVGHIREHAARHAARTPERCCDMHNQHCEPPSELCCYACTEASHDTFPIRHADGSRCVMDTEQKETT